MVSGDNISLDSGCSFHLYDVVRRAPHLWLFVAS